MVSPPSPPADLLDAEALLKIGGLELVARTVVDGAMSGLHRSTHKGGCSEFDEHRPYAQGDDLRLIDWRILARRDRYYVKQFEDETNLHAWMVLDASGSMQFGRSTMTKFEYARMACACLARLLLRQRDSIGLMLESDGQKYCIPPRPQADHFLSLVETLRTTQAGGPTNVSQTLFDLISRLKRRGLVIIFSDCFGEIDEFTASLQQLRLRGHDVLVFQVLAPEEVHFTFRDSAIFENLESRSHRLQLNAGQIRRRYLEQFNLFQQKLQIALSEVDCELVTMTTDQNLGDVLAAYLLRRAAGRRLQSAASG